MPGFYRADGRGPGGVPARMNAAMPMAMAMGDDAPLHFQAIADRGACRKTGVMAQNRWPGQEAMNTGELMT